jgi:hypothetical protein
MAFKRNIGLMGRNVGRLQHGHKQKSSYTRHGAYLRMANTPSTVAISANMVTMMAEAMMSARAPSSYCMPFTALTLPPVNKATNPALRSTPAKHQEHVSGLWA